MINPFKTIVYSDPGVGKTTLFGTVIHVPEMCPSLIIDFEGNLDSIASHCVWVPIKDCLTPVSDPTKITCVRVTSFKEFFEVFTLLDNIDDDKFPYKTVFVDSLSALDWWTMQDVVKTNNFKRSIKGVPGLEDFKTNYYTMQNIFYNIRNWNAHILCACHVEIPFSDDEGDGMIRPLLTGKLKQTISGIFKQTFFMTQRNGKRIMRFQPKGKFFAKDCSEGGVFGEELEEPTMLKLYNKKYGKV